MIIDAHSHVYPPSIKRRREEIIKTDATFSELFSNPTAKLAEVPELLASMANSRVDTTVIMGIGWNNIDFCRESNTYILESANDHPGTLFGFCSTNPLWGDAGIREIERCAAQGARGIGELHPDTQNFDITDRNLLAPIMEIAKRLDLITLVHASEPIGHQYPGKGNTTPDKLWAFIQNFPDNTIICAHWGGGLPFYSLMPEVRRGLENVYFDSAASPFLYQENIFEHVTNILGVDHIILGTDYPIISQDRLIEQIGNSTLTSCQKTKVMGGNARKLLGI